MDKGLNTTSTNGVPDNPADLNALLDLLKEIEQVLKVRTLKTSLSRSFNLTANQLDDTLQWVGTGINSAGVAISLNATFTSGTPDNPADLNAVLTLMKEIERVLALFNNLKFKEESIAYLTSNPAALGIVDLKALTLDQLKALTFYKKLITLEGEAEPTVQTLQDNYLASGAFSDGALLAELWQQDRSLIDSLIKALTLPPVPIEAIEYLWEALRICQTLGINGYSLQKLVDDADFAGLVVARDVALGAFSSKYDDEKVRQEKLRPYQDGINVIKRDALCDYTIARERELNFKDKSDIYAFFLLDVEMSGCFRTSRVVAAISSLQLYVHRILANLEQSASDSNLVVLALAYEMDAFKREWEWRKNYRVWEANRKVFVYPENYIEPDLRDNKTPIFRELEDDLLQEKISQESADDAYRKYVTGLTELAKLRIVGSYYHTEDERYYLFGRTHTQPYQYYYRTYERVGDQDVWGNWVKMELAIEAGEISALVHLGRLYVFWTQVERREISYIEEAKSKAGGHVFKVFAKYSHLNEHGKWCAAQRVNVGYLYFDDEAVRKRVWPGTAALSDTERTVVAERFQEEVFRKPYPVLTDDLAWPIQLYYIWSDDKPLVSDVPVDVTERYTTAPYNGVEDYLDAVTYNRVDRVCEDEYASGNVSVPSYQVGVVNGAFPLTRSVAWELSGRTIRNRGTLELLSPTQGAIEIRFPDPRLIAPGCADRLYQATEKRIAVSVETFGSSTSTEAAYAPNVSSHDLSLATTLVKDVGDIKPKFARISSDSFLQKEYEVAYASDHPGGYVQDGTNGFTAQERAVYQRQWNSYELMVPNRPDGIALSTILIDELSERIFAQELDEFLSVETQTRPYTGGMLDFDGPYGNYYWEVFFHIPFLIANHLNANQKFAEAQWWYERIFDPTNSDPPVSSRPNDRIWRYTEFRDLNIERMRDILLNGEAIKRYKDDPFNPHAIARLRPSAYQKTIVMKFIDNLIDWGDQLFAQDSAESINEATMLYMLAADILGKRPAKLGKCETADDGQLTYWNIGPVFENGAATESSDFLFSLENWIFNGLMLTPSGSPG